MRAKVWWCAFVLVTPLSACGTATPAAPMASSEAGVGDAATYVDAALSEVGPSDATMALLDAAPLVGLDAARTYDQVVLGDHPVGYWTMAGGSAKEPDRTGGGNAGTYEGATPMPAPLPNGDTAVDFNGTDGYLTIPSEPAYSIATTGELSWEGWIRPDVLQFPKSTGGYVDWMGKCAHYSPTCEWESRMYTTTNDAGRPNRFSAYAFNLGAGLGSGADWQPVAGLIAAGDWYHVVGEYSTKSAPSVCPDAGAHPGTLNIWVNGVLWNQVDHAPTGCMSQYSVTPTAATSPVNVGTMATDSWFPGAIGKVALYSYLLSSTQIAEHYMTMTGHAPSGTCGNTCSF